MVFQSVILLLWSFALVYISCEFGHRLSTAFIEIDHEIGQIHWYKLPQKIWKMLPLAMAAAQKPIYLRVFGSIACAREDFKAVCMTYECTKMHGKGNNRNLCSGCPYFFRW